MPLAWSIVIIVISTSHVWGNETVGPLIDSYPKIHQYKIFRDSLVRKEQHHKALWVSKLHRNFRVHNYKEVNNFFWCAQPALASYKFTAQNSVADNNYVQHTTRVIWYWEGIGKKCKSIMARSSQNRIYHHCLWGPLSTTEMILR